MADPRPPVAPEPQRPPRLPTAPTQPREPTTQPRPKSSTTARRTPTGSRTPTPRRPTSTVVIPPIHSSSSSAPLLPSPTSSPPPEATSGGLSGGAIGGIAAGAAVAVAAVVGLLFYKRRKRVVAVAKDENTKDSIKDGPLYLSPLNYDSSNNGGANASSKGGNMQEPVYPSPFGMTNDPYDQNKRGEDRREFEGRYGGGNAPDSKPYGSGNGVSYGGQHDYYEQYFEGTSEPIGAQRSPQPTREAAYGNMTPAPEYHLGSDNHENANQVGYKHEVYDRDTKSPTLHAKGSHSGGSNNPSTEQNLNVHQPALAGDKTSISSYESLAKHSRSPQGYPLSQETATLAGPKPPQEPGIRRDHGESQHTMPSVAPNSASISVSDSVMSMMPSLPPVAAAGAPGDSIDKNHARQGSDPRMHGQQRGNGGGHGAGPYDDPYADQSYYDGNSNNQHRMQSPPYYGGGGGGGQYSQQQYPRQHQYSPHGTGREYSPYTSPYQGPQSHGPYRNGNGGGNRQQNGGGGHGYGPGPNQHGGWNHPPNRGGGAGGGGGGGGYGPPGRQGYGPQNGGRAPNYQQHHVPF